MYDIAIISGDGIGKEVMNACEYLLDKLDLDENEIFNENMSRNEAKYPVDKSMGKADKYDRL